MVFEGEGGGEGFELGVVFDVFGNSGIVAACSLVNIIDICKSKGESEDDTYLLEQDALLGGPPHEWQQTP